MAMLRLGETAFSVGRARFYDDMPDVGERGARVYVTVAVSGMDEPILALLDTGAQWSVLAREIAEEAGLLDADGEPIVMHHRGGRTPGKLVPTTVTMFADEGQALEVEAVVFVPDVGDVVRV